MFVRIPKSHNPYKILKMLFPAWQIDVQGLPSKSTSEKVLYHAVLSLAGPVQSFFPESRKIYLYSRAVIFSSPEREVELTFFPDYNVLVARIHAILDWLEEIELPYIVGVDTNLKVLSEVTPRLARTCEDTVVAKALLDMLGIVRRLSDIESLPEVKKVMLEYKVGPLTNYRVVRYKGPVVEVAHPQLEEILSLSAKPLFIGVTYDWYRHRPNMSNLKRVPVDQLEKIVRALTHILEKSNLLGEGYSFAEVYPIDNIFKFLYPEKKILIEVTPLDKPEVTIWLYPRYVTKHVASYRTETTFNLGDFKTKIKIPLTDTLFTEQRQDLEQALEKARMLLSAAGRKDKYWELAESVRSLEKKVVRKNTQ